MLQINEVRTHHRRRLLGVSAVMAGDTRAKRGCGRPRIIQLVVCIFSDFSGLTACWARENLPTYPLKVSETGRYLVDRADVPFMIIGDSPQSLIGNLSPSEADQYFANRRARGFNTL